MTSRYSAAPKSEQANRSNLSGASDLYRIHWPPGIVSTARVWIYFPYIFGRSTRVANGATVLWQSAHSEFYFTDAPWPAFRKISFLRAIRLFQQRRRRLAADPIAIPYLSKALQGFSLAHARADSPFINPFYRQSSRTKSPGRL